MREPEGRGNAVNLSSGSSLADVAGLEVQADHVVAVSAESGPGALREGKADGDDTDEGGPDGGSGEFDGTAGVVFLEVREGGRIGFEWGSGKRFGPSRTCWLEIRPGNRRSRMALKSAGPAPSPASMARGHVRVGMSRRVGRLSTPMSASWVTDPPLGLARTAALRVLGNGVVPQQAVAALRILLCEHRWQAPP